MQSVESLLGRIDLEISSEVEKERQFQEVQKRLNQERKQRLTQYEATANQVVEILKPRIEAFLDRAKHVVKAEPVLRSHTRSVILTFASSQANVLLKFEMYPDAEIKKIQLVCEQEFVPSFFRYEKQSVMEIPFGQVQEEAIAAWFDDRVVGFLKLYLDMVRNDNYVREHLKDELVEDPVSKRSFPRYLASSSLDRDGKTYYFANEQNRRTFEGTAKSSSSS